MHLKVKDNVGALPPSIGDGSIRLINLQNGVQIILFDYFLKEDIIFHRKKANQSYYVMRIDEAPEQNENTKAALFFSDANTEWYYMAPANTKIRTMHVLFSKNWLQELLINEPKGETLISNVLLKSTLYHYEILDSEYKRLLSHITQRKTDPSFEQLEIHNAVMFILERSDSILGACCVSDPMPENFQRVSSKSPRSMHRFSASIAIANSLRAPSGSGRA